MSLPYTFTAGTLIYASQVNANFAACALADLSNITTSIGIAQGGTGTTTAFTLGSVLFATTAGVYSQNNSNFFWDNSNNRLGIGTSVPASALDVRGSAAFGQMLTTGTAVSTDDTALLLGGSRTGSGNSYVSLFANGSSSASAQVYRASGANGTLTIGNTGTGTLFIQQTGAAGIQFNTNGATNVTIASGGNVGIGTTSPAYTLDVTGTIRATGTITGSISGNANTVTNGIYTTNIGSYAPTLTGGGASGTWDISISGNANTVTNGIYTTNIGSYAPTLTGGGASGTWDISITGQANALNSSNSYTVGGMQINGSAGVSNSGDGTNGGYFGLLNTNTSGGRIFRISGGSSTDMQILNSPGTEITHVFADNGDFIAQANIYGAAKYFCIPHPLPTLSTSTNLVHIAVEAPQADLIYRGQAKLVDGKIQVDIDQASRMTDGTFVVLCTNVQCFTTNETSWTPVRGSVSGNILTIEAQDETSTDTISWMVIGERQDATIANSSSTDDNGRIITETPSAANNGLKDAPPVKTKKTRSKATA